MARLNGESGCLQLLLGFSSVESFGGSIFIHWISIGVKIVAASKNTGWGVSTGSSRFSTMPFWYRSSTGLDGWYLLCHFLYCSWPPTLTLKCTAKLVWLVQVAILSRVFLNEPLTPLRSWVYPGTSVMWAMNQKAIPDASMSCHTNSKDTETQYLYGKVGN